MNVGAITCQPVFHTLIAAQTSFDKCICSGGKKGTPFNSFSKHFSPPKGWDHKHFQLFKGTGTRDLTWPKVVSLDRSWLVGLMDNLYNFLKCCFIFLIIFQKSLVVLAKIMPIKNANRIVFVY